MQIELTQTEYRALIDMLFLSNWMMNAYNLENYEKNDVFHNVEQKIFSKAKEFGFDDLIVYDNKHEEFFPSDAYREKSSAYEFIEKYDEETFWEELIERMSLRDISESYDFDKFVELDEEEQIDIRMEFEERYSIEFEENGISNLRLFRNPQE